MSLKPKGLERRRKKWGIYLKINKCKKIRSTITRSYKQNASNKIPSGMIEELQLDILKKLNHTMPMGIGEKRNGNAGLIWSKSMSGHCRNLKNLTHSYMLFLYK